MTEVYELLEDEGVVAMLSYGGRVMIATSERVFQMWHDEDGVRHVELVLYSKGESDDG